MASSPRVLALSCLLVAILAAPAAAQNNNQRTPVVWSTTTRTKAVRLAQYTAALRCKWPRVAAWECTDCRTLRGATLIYSWTEPLYDDAADAFTIHHDSQLGLIVVTFRSTYGNKAGWESNLDGLGEPRVLGGRTYTMHRSFARSYFDCVGKPCLRQPLIEGARLALARHPGVPVVFVGHSRGGAMAVIAAADAVTDLRTTLGVRRRDLWDRIQLYTFGQPRVGSQAFATLIENNIGERFRIVNSADPTPHIPPNAETLASANGVLNTVVRGVQAVLAVVPAWIKREIPLLNGVTTALSYYHHGTYILLLDYLDAAGRSVIGEMVCAASDVDLPCNAAAGLAAAASTKRRLVGPFAWEGAFGKPLNFWPVFTFLDHGWYMGVDVGNERCVGMKPPGWWGWKMDVGTSPAFLSGTNGDTRVSWSCGAAPMTNGLLPLQCGLGLGEALSGDFSDVDCFESGDIDVFEWENHKGTAGDGTSLLDTQTPLPACIAAGMKPVVTLEHTSTLLSNGLLSWQVGSLALELGYTQGANDSITTRLWGDCTPGIEDALKFGLGKVTLQRQLCETVPRWSWRLGIATANTARAGTDGDVRVTWRCGALNATTGFAPVKCGALRNCFERNQVDTFEVGFDSGRWSPTDVLTPANYPLPACLAAGGAPVITVSFKGNGLLDAWEVDAARSYLELRYLPTDVTSFWSETAGNDLYRTRTQRWRPCTLGVRRFERTADWVSRDVRLCPV